MNEAIRMQMEVQRRLHEQLEVINQPRIKVCMDLWIQKYREFLIKFLFPLLLKALGSLLNSTFIPMLILMLIYFSYMHAMQQWTFLYKA
jgi:hypothetical protein